MRKEAAFFRGKPTRLTNGNVLIFQYNYQLYEYRMAKKCTLSKLPLYFYRLYGLSISELTKKWHFITNGIE